MSRIGVLLKDVPADKGRHFRTPLLSPEQWDDLIAAFERGVSVKTIFATLSGNITPFYRNPGALQAAIYMERKRRKARSK